MRPQPRKISRFFIVSLYYRSWGSRVSGLRKDLATEPQSHREEHGKIKAILCWYALCLCFSVANIRNPQSSLGLRYRSGIAAHPVKRLFYDPTEHGLVIVVMPEHVLRRREAMGVAALLHLAELFAVELVIFDGPPVISGGIHREAGRDRPVRANQHGVVSGAAMPRVDVAAHEELHLLKVRLRVDHDISLPVLLGQVVEKLVHLGPVFG